MTRYTAAVPVRFLAGWRKWGVIRSQAWFAPLDRAMGVAIDHHFGREHGAPAAAETLQAKVPARF